MTRSSLILLLSLFIMGCESSQQQFSTELLQDRFETAYDHAICEASKTYLPVPTRLFGCALYKAQLYQESLLDPNARSPAGAEGIAQFMAPTWEETLMKMGEATTDRTNASVAIRAGAYYMMTLREIWTSDRTERDRMSLAQACYNAGCGNVLKAQRLCDGALNWSTIQNCLPEVTRHHSRETIQYVQRIWSYWEKWIQT